MNNDRFQPLVDAMKRFVRDTKADGHEVRAWLPSNPSTNITGIQTDGDYVLVFTLEPNGTYGMVVMQKSHFAIHMASEPPATGGGVGFLQLKD